MARGGCQIRGWNHRQLRERAALGGIEPRNDLVTHLPDCDLRSDLLDHTRQIGAERVGESEREEVMHGSALKLDVERVQASGRHTDEYLVLADLRPGFLFECRLRTISANSEYSHRQASFAGSTWAIQPNQSSRCQVCVSRSFSSWWNS